MRTRDIGGTGRRLNPNLQRLRDLEILNAWRDELQTKVRRSELLFEHFGVDVGYERLADEVAGFSAVLAGLGEQQWREAPTQPLKLIRGGKK